MNILVANGKGGTIGLIFLIVGIVVLLGILFFVLFKFVFSKNRYKRQVKELERKFAYLDALLVGQDSQYIHRLEIISHTNLLYLEKYESFQKRFKDIYENDDKYAETIIKNLSALLANSQYKNIKTSILEGKKALQIFENSVNALDKDLYDIIKLEENSRQVVLHLKEDYRRVKQNYLNNSNDLEIVSSSISRIFDKLDSYFLAYDNHVDSAEYDDAEALVPTISKVINAVDDVLHILPNLCALVESVIPDKIRDLNEEYLNIEKEGIPLYHLGFKNRINDWKKRLKDIKTRLIDLDVSHLSKELDKIQSEIEEMRNLLHKEQEDKAFFEENVDKVYKEVILLEKQFIKICNILPKIKEVYVISNEQNDLIDKLHEDIDKVSASKRTLDGYIHSATRQPFSALRKILEDLESDYKVAYDGVNNFQAFLENLRSSCEEAYNMVFVYYYRAKYIELILRNVAVESFSACYEERINEVYELLDDIDKNVKIQPIDVDSINEKVETLKSLGNSLFDEVENKEREAQLAESAIVYANRDRQHTNDVQHSLLQLEENFFKGEFGKVYHDASALFSRNHIEGNNNGQTF